MKTLGKLVGIVLLVLAGIVVFNTFRATSLQISVQPVPKAEVNPQEAAGVLGRAIQFRTIFAGSPTGELLKFREFLDRTFPRVSAKLTKEIFEGHTVLRRWPGLDPSLDPVLLMAHMDVVPVESETEESWNYPPFSGQVAEGYIWGRGTLDVKVSVTGILAAVEHLLKAGYQPQRTIYLSFGHDEEIGGSGALAVADAMLERGVTLSAVLDEGLAVTQDLIPGLFLPVAVVGIAEKGALSLRLSIEVEGGHSAMPPRRTASGRMATALSRLETHPFPGEIKGPVQELFRYLAPEMKFPHRAMFSNLWLFGPLIQRQLAQTPSTDATLRTTMAITRMESGIKENVLPSRASAVLNFRILSGDTVERILERVRKIVDDPEIKILPLAHTRNPSPVSNPRGKPFEELARSIQEAFPLALVAPGLVLGGTDSRHFTDLCENVYRFVPIIVGPEDVSRVHGLNERVSVENYEQVIQFYIRLIQNWGSNRTF